ncbi:alpha/beta fold hydrolase [Rathayibacter sp. VKM Ac-2835]|uniref:alpha/beta fold hydrolase n=1 Tax=Rathayibacter sp. VKM Ac-2835 TaxID=2739043 RepID=UPI0020B66EED|nr:alpha/beta hydrolase [Rathayibacter sp. VKM Ac-2835]
MPDFTTDDGVRLSWTEQGDPAGRPVVLIAGFTAPATSWKPQQGPLAEAGYRVISFDRRGHGLSERTEAGATMVRHGADLAQLLRHLDLQGAALVGGSMGDNSIWAFLEGTAGGTAGSTDASRVDRIVIIDQTPRMLDGDDWPYGFYDYTEANRDTLFATTIPDPGRWSARPRGGADRAAAEGARRRRAPGADRDRAAAAERPREGGLAAGDRSDERADALRRRARERVLAGRARGRRGLARPARRLPRDREGRPRGEHRAAEGLHRGAAGVPGALSAPCGLSPGTPCPG